MWSIIQLLWAIRSQNFHHLSDHKMSCDRSRCLWAIILLSFDVPSIIYLLLYFMTIYKSRNFKVIPACDRSYNSYERSEVKIFIIWVIIKCLVIDQGGLWAIILLSFDVPSIIYLLLYFMTIYKGRNFKVIPACDRSYNSYERSEAKIFII